MGGGGGFSPIPIITSLIFGPEAGALAGALTGGGASGASGAGTPAVDSAQLQAAQQAEEQAAAARRAEDRRAEEAVLKATARRQQAALRQRSAGTLGDASQDASGTETLAGQSMRAGLVQAPQLKEKLGQ